ncbi:Rho-type GTPase activating protein Rga1 [Recurvomyces mirabilis]|nr:Rho-type GTPase activating protein Rga1 [Recurvomyces mirabilis]
MAGVNGAPPSNSSHYNQHHTPNTTTSARNGSGRGTNASESQDLAVRPRPNASMEMNGRDVGGVVEGVGAVEERRPPGARRPSGQQRTCGKCQRHLTGQFVRALGDTYHLECFTCHDCDKIVASKFFPVPDHPPNQYPLCETDYFRRLELLCFACGGALRGSYITALDRKYHIEHFTCSVCPTVFGAQDSYYEHESSVYCHYHYSTRFAQKCNGCQTAILKQFVEIFRNGMDQHWHPECYMIHKYWNVRLHAPAPKGSDLAGEEAEAERQRGLLTEQDASEELRTSVRKDEEAVEYKVHWIWQTLSTFEEKSATCISDMLLHVSNGAYMDGVVAAKKFITHVDILFAAADELDHRLQTRPTKNSAGGDKQIRTFEAIVHPGLSYSREAKLLCKKVVAFFQLLAESQDHGVRRLGVTQELLSLVTGLAHYLKLMIRICLSGALKLERETGSQEGLEGFLGAIGGLDESVDGGRVGRGGFPAAGSAAGEMLGQEGLVDKMADTCAVCDKAVEDKCFRREGRVLHAPCLACGKCGRDLSEEATLEPGVKWSSSGRGAGDVMVMRVWCDVHSPQDANRGVFFRVSRLRQYVHLLRVAHARLLATLRSGGALPHTSDDPNLLGYDNSDGRHTPASEAEPPLLRSNTRSRSYAGRTGSQRSAAAAAEQGSSSYEDAMGDIRRLRSTRMDKQLSNAGRHARKSRIIDGPEGLRSGSPPNDDYGSNGYSNGNVSASTKAARRTTGSFQIVEDRDPMSGEPRSQLTFGGQDTMTLDDIPRIVQAQQTREQRPNASRFARGGMMPQEPRARLVDGSGRGHGRDGSGGEGIPRRGTVNGGGMMGAGSGGAVGGGGDGGGGGRMPGTKRYFSELTALEYFIVRHVAVLSMEPLLEGHFNQEELLELIETKRPTFWSKFGKAFQPGKDRKGGKPSGGQGGNGASSPAEKNSGSKDAAAPQKIFGVPLETLLERDYAESTDGVGPGSLKIPSLVQEAISAMKTMDMSVEGVFRKNGNIKRLNDLKEEVDTRGTLEGVDLTKENPVQVAALLKKFLRELPDPLLLHKLHKLWITSQRIVEEERRRRVLHLTCCLLPKAHRDTLEVLCTFLQWVSSFCQVDEESGSKMDVHNLATVITPNILAPWPGGREGGKEGKEGGVDESFLGIEAVCALIECNEAMCEVPEDLAMILNDSSLFSNTADITTKEILKRYNEVAKAPPRDNANRPGGLSSPAGGAGYADRDRDRNVSSPQPTRVDVNPTTQTQRAQETSVRHVGGDGMISYSGPGGEVLSPPGGVGYKQGRRSGEEGGGGGSGSPSRGVMRTGPYGEQRALGVA